MMKRSLLLFCLLAACATPEQIAEARRLQAAQDQQTCREYGFRQRSDAFSNCLLQLQIAREQQPYNYDRSYYDRPHFSYGYYHYR